MLIFKNDLRISVIQVTIEGGRKEGRNSKLGGSFHMEGVDSLNCSYGGG
ncbi:hypothetical protein IC582_013704 [Cucumis melo]